MTSKMNGSFLDKSVGYTMNMGAMLLKRELASSFSREGHDITPEQWAILSRLKERDGVNQNEIALITFKDNANITRIVDKLELKRLVERRQDSRDGRAWLLYITPLGRAMVGKLQPLAAEVLGRATRGMSKQEIELCNRGIQKIIENLQ